PRPQAPGRELQGHAGAAARPRRDARQVPAADPALRPRGNGAAVRTPAGPRTRAHRRLDQGRGGQAAADGEATAGQEMTAQSLATRVAAAVSPTLADAAHCLAGGGLVAFPTETVYGLGADATNGAAVA